MDVSSHGGMKPSAPEIFAMALLSVLILATGILIAYLNGGFTLQYPDAGGTPAHVSARSA